MNEPAVVRVTVRVVLLLSCVAGALWLLYRLRGILLLLALAVFFAYLIAPFVDRLRRPLAVGGRTLALPFGAAAGIAFFVILAAIAVAAVQLVPILERQAVALAAEAPAHLARIQTWWRSWQADLRRRNLPPQILEAIDGWLGHVASGATSYLRGRIVPALGDVFAHVPWLFLVPIFSFFLLKDAGRFRRSALGMFPARTERFGGEALFDDINVTLAAYIRAQLISCFLVGGICTVAFVLLGLPYAVLLGIAAGFAEFVPLAGPVSIAVVAVVAAGFVSIPRAVATLVFLLSLRLLQDYVIYPKIVGREIDLHPMAIILAILCGGELAGLAGVFLSVPVLAILVVAFRHWRRDLGPGSFPGDGLLT